MVLSPFSVNKTLINNKTLTISGFAAHEAASSQYGGVDTSSHAHMKIYAISFGNVNKAFRLVFSLLLCATLSVNNSEYFVDTYYYLYG